VRALPGYGLFHCSQAPRVHEFLEMIKMSADVDPTGLQFTRPS
jgi:hypothetical protein